MLCPLCKGVVGIEPLVPIADIGMSGRERHDSRRDTGKKFKCKNCGTFIVSDRDVKDFLLNEDHRDEAKLAMLSALLLENQVHGLPPIWICFRLPNEYRPLKKDEAFDEETFAPVYVGSFLAKWPQSIAERIDRVLINLSKLSDNVGHDIPIYADDVPFFLSRNNAEANYIYNWLCEVGYIQAVPNAKTRLLVKAWSRIDELGRGRNSKTNPAFVAMWFGDATSKAELNELFQQSIYPAITKAGYRVERADLQEHSDYIMDKVLASIRLAPFVVADFTGNRNGVYFEAGFGRGLGIPVITSCKETHLSEAHFDAQQLNHLLWESPVELHDKLYHRIMAMLGMGPYSTVPEVTNRR